MAKTTMAFTDWIDRWNDDEYSLLRHKMQAVQFIGMGIYKYWDKCVCNNEIDLADQPVAETFRNALVSEDVISSERAEEIFALPKDG